MFRSAFEQGAQLGAGPVARLWRGFLLFFSRWWQLETLYRSNMKYQPEWIPRYACYEDARLIPRVGVASVIAEGFLVLPFSRRDKVHTGHHPAVPARLAESGLLHHDGSAPDVSDLQRREGAAEAEESKARLPEQVRVRLTKLKTLQRSGVDAYPVGNPTQSHDRAGPGRRRPGTRFGVGPDLADTRLRRGAVRPVARLVRRDSGAAGRFAPRARPYRGLHRGHRPRRPGRDGRAHGLFQERHPLVDRGRLADDR